jgi:hypothetical protein
VATDNYTHDFEVQHKEPHHLPGEKFTPETGIPGRKRGICFVFISFNNVFLNHFLTFSGFG